ncbi:MAG: TolC family protein, partial [Planctomycetota bacterium]
MRWTILSIVLMIFTGCIRTRQQYRGLADRDSTNLIRQKSAGYPWQPRDEYSVYPHPASRWQVQGPLDCPQLPDPAPKLYAYDLPLPEEPIQKPSPKEGETSDPDPVGSAIPPNAWYEIPVECRQRMFDFVRLKEEAKRTSEEFEIKIETETGTGIPKLDLREIVELGLLNSRNYQSQKEALYQVALALSLERFQYQLNPTPNGNGLVSTFTHTRFGGITVDNLGFGSNYAFQRILCTGGDFLASFANNVLLTFNGPQGFAADVSSDLLFEFTQPIFQRDIRFESLTRAERNVVYAARDFARFRKQFFTDFATQYYSLIRSYRQIEIESQNYFSLVRAFNQAEAEYRAGLVPRFQVDQVEQNLLNGRGSLIGTCNSVEQALDSLKLAMGIPVESLINIDLTELDELTRFDQLAVDA